MELPSELGRLISLINVNRPSDNKRDDDLAPLPSPSSSLTANGPAVLAATSYPLMPMTVDSNEDKPASEVVDFALMNVMKTMGCNVRSTALPDDDTTVSLFSSVTLFTDNHIHTCQSSLCWLTATASKSNYPAHTVSLAEPIKSKINPTHRYQSASLPS